ncbi:MAG: hypothetical protein JSW00_12490 [Thermoplasmata archaeon]|nr:MAG: hypothetical protein JSW00_12490 [Thermoplasmata archaeon]
MTRKIARLGGLIVCCLLIIGNSPIIVVGDCQKPEWKVGDEWKYNMTVMGIKVKVTHKVTEVTNINVNGTDYEVYHVEVKGAGGTEHQYYTKNDLSLVKREVPSTTVTSSYTITYNPPKKEFDFPLVIGKNWVSECNEHIYGEDIGYANITVKDNYTIVGMESVSLSAGVFECYKIESVDRYEITYTTRWYSEEVKNVVKSSVNMSGVVTEMELDSFSSGTEDDDGEEENGSGPKDSSDDLPLIFIPIIIVIVIVVLVFILLRSRKGKAKGQQPPQASSVPPPIYESPPFPPQQKPPQSL